MTEVNFICQTTLPPQWLWELFHMNGSQHDLSNNKGEPMTLIAMFKKNEKDSTDKVLICDPKTPLWKIVEWHQKECGGDKRQRVHVTISEADAAEDISI